MLAAERVAVLADVLGRDLHFEALPDEQARRQMSESMAAPLVDAFFEFSRGGTYRDDQVGAAAPALLGARCGPFATGRRPTATPSAEPGKPSLLRRG